MHGTSVVDVSDLMRLTFLAPEMVEWIVEAVNRELTTQALRTRRFDIPVDWAAQKRALGVPSCSPVCVSTKMEL